MKLSLIAFFILLYSIDSFCQNFHMDSLCNNNYIMYRNLPSSKFSETYNPVDGQHYSFLINKENQLMVKTGNGKWKYFCTSGIDFKKNRNGDTIDIGEVDMVSADGNRLLIKRVGSNELYFALLVMKENNSQVYYIINDPQPQLGLKKDDVKSLITNYNLIRTYSEKTGLNLLTLILKKRHKKRPFWLVEVQNAQTWYSIEYIFNKKNELIHDIALTHVNPFENDSLYPNNSGYSPEIGGDYHWPLFNKWYSRWLRKDVKCNRHYTTFIDGAVAYYILTKNLSDFKTEIHNLDTIVKSRFKVYFTDEQTYFSGDFRLLGPDENSPAFSAQREALRSNKNLDNEKHLPWKPEKQWWDFYDLYFDDCSIDGAVENIIVAVKKKIYSINWTYWSMDFTWRTRNKPNGANSCGGSINRNMNIIVPGDSLNYGFYQQKLLPSDNVLPQPNGKELYFKHENNWKYYSTSSR